MTLNTASATIGGLALQSGATLDIGINTLFINYGNGSTPLAAVQAGVQYGAGGVSSANGSIISSTANAGNRGQFAVGYADATELGSIPSGNLELMYTLTGDAQLKGTVNFLDYSVMQNNYNQTGRDWAQGDWDDNGTVNFLDYSLLQNNYNQSVAGAITGSAVAAGVQVDRSGNSVAMVLPLWTSDQNQYGSDAVTYGWTAEDAIGYQL